MTHRFAELGLLRALLPRACEAVPLARVPWLALCGYLLTQGEDWPSLDLRCQHFVDQHPGTLVPRARPYLATRPRWARKPLSG